MIDITRLTTDNIIANLAPFLLPAPGSFAYEWESLYKMNANKCLFHKFSFIFFMVYITYVSINYKFRELFVKIVKKVLKSEFSPNSSKS